jgi:hypothetical protein
LPLPYCFDPSAFGPLPAHVTDVPLMPVEHDVEWLVVLLGFTPGVDVAAFACCFAWPGDELGFELEGAGVELDVVAFFSCPGACELGWAGWEAGVASACFTWPGAFAELPLPESASAVPVRTSSASAIMNAPVARLNGRFISVSPLWTSVYEPGGVPGCQRRGGTKRYGFYAVSALHRSGIRPTEKR